MKSSLISPLLLICLLYLALSLDARALGPRAPNVASGHSVDDEVYFDQDNDDGTDHGRDGQTKYMSIGQQPQEERVNGARKVDLHDDKKDTPKKPITPLALNTKIMDTTE